MAKRGSRVVPFQQMVPSVRWFRVDVANTTDVDGTALAQDTNNNAVQWRYDVTEMTKTAPGYGGWTAKPANEGLVTHTETVNSVTVTVNAAYNIYEDQNDGTGIQPATGVDHDGADFLSTMDMTPLQVDATYPGFVVAVANVTVGTDYEIWLLGPNGEDGTCA